MNRMFLTQGECLAAALLCLLLAAALLTTMAGCGT